MLTRLRVQGFKNLVDVDVRFGPFTCIAGPNGVGKSNLFDAIQFLSLLADHPLLDAARRVRGGSRLRNLFHRTADDQVPEMLFEAEMIVPQRGRDDLGQDAVASSTFLRYRLRLAHRPGSTLENVDRLVIVEEGLEYITKGEAHKHVHFDHSARAWRDSVVLNRKYGESFISTQSDEEERPLIRLHQDGGGSRGRPLTYLASSLPRTVLSSTNAAESPTALLARREMQSWRLIQLEPSALRQSDSFTDPTHLGSDGSHLAGTLYRLGNGSRGVGGDGDGGPGDEQGRVYAEVANRLSTFLDDVREVSVDRDVKRELLTVEVRTVGQNRFPAAALSDGTLRFLALAVFEIDPEATGVLCLEEPENGVHPARVPSMLALLRRIAVDPHEPVDSENPLRQVIVSTHSPAVVQQVPEDTLLLASPTEHVLDTARRNGVAFRHLRDTWRERARPGSSIASLGDLLTYLSPSLTLDAYAELVPRDRPRRVVDRSDVQRLLPFAADA